MNVHEVTLAGFDGGSDATDDLVVWVRGDRDDIERVLAGTSSRLCDPVQGAAEHDVDYALPGDLEEFEARVAQCEADLGPPTRPSP